MKFAATMTDGIAVVATDAERIKKRDDTWRHFKHTCMFAASKFNLILLHNVFVACQLNNVRAREQRLSSDLVWL